jgi:hypothetical protein
LGPKVLKAGAGYDDPGKHGPEEEEAEGLLADVTVESLSPPTQVSPSTFRYLIDNNFYHRMRAWLWFSSIICWR